ncbi:MAG: hypothetical protein MJ131_07080 [Lachnospiraceae bacterium]|nr:hypothetical protein [Lachnospiraceae bacterium]
MKTGTEGVTELIIEADISLKSGKTNGLRAVETPGTPKIVDFQERKKP